METTTLKATKWYVGWDWAKSKHQISVVDEAGKEVDGWEAPHTAEGLRKAVERLKKLAVDGEVCVAIETPHGLFVEALLEANFTLYVVHAKVAKRLREALVGESKNDTRDAWALAESLRLHGGKWKPLKTEDDLTRRLQILTRDEQGFIEQMNQLSNRLQHALGEYYPQALELFDDWTSPSAWAFVLEFGTPQALIAASWRKLQNFLHVHRLAKPQRLEGWKKIHERASQWPMSEVLSSSKQRQAQLLARQLQMVHRGLHEYRQAIEALWKEHPDQPIFSSFTGMGTRIGPRVMSEMGTDRSNFPDANAVQCYGGVVPRQEQSGNCSVARCRKGANHTLQHNLFLWAKSSVVWCPWARAFYTHYKKRGLWSADIYRRLAAKWTRILWKCWQERKPYDEALWLESLKKRGSWLYEATMKLTQQPLEPMEAAL
jgi:transposase